MVVIILERVSPSLRGELSRWLIEPKAGVFVGKVSALVRDKLWEKITKKIGDSGAAIQLWSTNNQQGFDARMMGDRTRILEDYEGILLVKRLKEDKKSRRLHS